MALKDFNEQGVDDSEINGNFRQSRYDADRNATLQCDSLSVSTTAVSLPDGETLLIRNNGGDSVYVGDSNVSTSDGVEIIPDKSLYLDQGTGAHIIAASGTQDVRVLISK